ncbi:hypothetical protein AX774_g4996 [Zancudomyces culisetae]|uniref:BZIP domain-containing protein n=1 Tax=Zancudomyces culisetae TaxID=1213189 RepID=A0A1R1PKR1_ZANCU|nr:hypothetical protein AX774_g4996 [Zancudomyces culisetae]|eukprot:OMH81546.1 hypothetical protein AX774_g4996 [Zancudomyces culisetae]
MNTTKKRTYTKRAKADTNKFKVEAPVEMGVYDQVTMEAQHNLGTIKDENKPVATKGARKTQRVPKERGKYNTKQSKKASNTNVLDSNGYTETFNNPLEQGYPKVVKNDSYVCPSSIEKNMYSNTEKIGFEQLGVIEGMSWADCLNPSVQLPSWTNSSPLSQGTSVLYNNNEGVSGQGYCSGQASETVGGVLMKNVVDTLDYLINAQGTGFEGVFGEGGYRSNEMDMVSFDVEDAKYKEKVCGHSAPENMVDSWIKQFINPDAVICDAQPSGLIEPVDTEKFVDSLDELGAGKKTKKAATKPVKERKPRVKNVDEEKAVIKKEGVTQRKSRKNKKTAEKAKGGPDEIVIKAEEEDEEEELLMPISKRMRISKEESVEDRGCSQELGRMDVIGVANNGNTSEKEYATVGQDCLMGSSLSNLANAQQGAKFTTILPRAELLGESKPVIKVEDVSNKSISEFLKASSQINREIGMQQSNGVVEQSDKGAIKKTGGSRQNVTPEQVAAKRQERLIKNRAAALLSRKKRREHMDNLELSVRRLEEENKQLRLRLEETEGLLEKINEQKQEQEQGQEQGQEQEQKNEQEQKPKFKPEIHTGKNEVVQKCLFVENEHSQSEFDPHAPRQKFVGSVLMAFLFSITMLCMPQTFEPTVSRLSSTGDHTTLNFPTSPTLCLRPSLSPALENRLNTLIECKQQQQQQQQQPNAPQLMIRMCRSISEFTKRVIPKSPVQIALPATPNCSSYIDSDPNSQLSEITSPLLTSRIFPSKSLDHSQIQTDSAPLHVIHRDFSSPQSTIDFSSSPPSSSSSSSSSDQFNSPPSSPNSGLTAVSTAASISASRINYLSCHRNRRQSLHSRSRSFVPVDSELIYRWSADVGQLSCNPVIHPESTPSHSNPIPYGSNMDPPANNRAPYSVSSN